MSLKTLRINCLLWENLSEKEYNYSLKLTGAAGDFSSEHSKSVKNPSGPQVRATTDQENFVEDYEAFETDEGKRIATKNYFSNTENPKSPKRMLVDKANFTESFKVTKNGEIRFPSSLSKVVVAFPTSETGATKKTHDNRLVWEYSDDDDAVPSIQVEINSDDFDADSLHFFLWSGRAASQNDQANSPLGGCFVELNRIYAEMINLDQKEPRKQAKFAYRKEISISEKLWNNGVCIGILEAKVLCEYNHFYRQLLCGVLTDQGVKKSAEVVLSKSEKSVFGGVKTTLTSEMKEINLLKEEVIQNADKVLAKDSLRMGVFLSEMMDDLKKLSTSLISSHKNPESLLAGQRIFVDLASHLLENCEKVPANIQALYIRCLNLVMVRGEFELQCMGFREMDSMPLLSNEKNSLSFKENMSSSQVKHKIKLAISFQRFLYKALEYALELSLLNELLDNERKEFIAIVFALAYFKVPEFGEKLVQKLEASKSGDINIDELSGAEDLFKTGSHAQKKDNIVVSLFEWQQNFHAVLKNASFLKELLERPKVFEAFEKRGDIFNSFLVQFTKYVTRTVALKQHIPWKYIPGYQILIKHFLVEIQKTDVKTLPKSLIDASAAMLSNEKLLTVLVALVYTKTSIYDSFAVCAVMDLINIWLKAFQTHINQIPSTFDDTFFLKGLYAVLDGEHALNIAKVLWMLFNNYNILSGAIKHQLCKYIFGDNFFKLFLHWSHDVRKMFFHLLLYRMYYQSRRPNFTIISPEDIRAELKRANQRRNSVTKAQRNLLIDEYASMEYAQYMTIIENAQKRFKEDIQQEKYVARMNKKRGFTRMHRNSEILTGLDSIKLRHAMSNSQADANAYQSRFDYKSETEGSFIVLNGNKCDTSVAESHRDNNNYLSLNDLDKKPSQQSDEAIDSLTPKGDLKLSKAFTEFKAKDPRAVTSSNNRQGKPQKFIYYDDNAEKYREIPREQLVYITRATAEFEQIKLNYIKWLQELNLDLSAKSGDEKERMLANPKVPDLVINMLSDKREP